MKSLFIAAALLLTASLTQATNLIFEKYACRADQYQSADIAKWWSTQNR